MSSIVYRSAQAAAAVEAKYRLALDQWPVPKTELRLETREGPTFVVTCGPEDAPAVVLLHGSQANAAAWMGDIAAWSARFRVYAIDMIGEPGFSAQVRPDLNSDAHALWLDDVFSGLGLTRAALVGTSLGGWLALDYAIRRPGFAQALALICPAGIGRQKNFLLKALPLLLLGSWGRRRMLELVFGPAPAQPPENMKPFADLMEALFPAVRPRTASIPVATEAQLGALTMPILAIVGGRDVLLDSRDTRDRLERCTRNAEVCFIEDGYHFLPDQTVRVLAFLDRHAT
jgi:pimeloyl-ACP methyl ester carboxylesterase